MLAEREHYGELTLRRYFVGENPDEVLTGQITGHLEECAACREQIEALVAEAGAFEAAIPFERFAAGVEQKLVPRPASSMVRQWIAPFSAVAAAAAVILVVALPRPGTSIDGRRNTIKGSPAVVDLYVGGLGGQRTAASREPLGEGERIRISYRPGSWAYLAVISVDEAGEVSTLYPEAGESLPVAGEPRQTRMLPDSVGFSGQGLERIVVVFTNEPLSGEALRAAAGKAFDEADGDVDRMGDLDLPGEHFHRLVIKP